MKSVSAHLAECLKVVGQLPPLAVSLADASGCVLAEDAISRVNVPSQDLSTCDGYAVRCDDIAGIADGQTVTLPVLTDIIPGADAVASLAKRSAILVSSGAPIPRGADTVVPLEFTDGGRTTVTIGSSFPAGSFIKTRGAELEAGKVALTSGTRVGPRHISLLAAAGLGTLLVHPAPRVIVMSIGNELVEPGQAGLPGSVFDANSHALTIAARDLGAHVSRVAGVPDDKTELKNAIRDQLVRADLIITTGGLSYGGGDTLKDVLAPLGTVRFDRVAIHPGRQFGIGTVAMEGDDDVAIIALPGDPATALIGFDLFVRPVLKKMAGYAHAAPRTIRAVSTIDWISPADKEEYVPVYVSGKPSEGYRLKPLTDRGEIRLAGLASANALAIIDEGVERVPMGESVTCMLLSER